MKLGNEISLQYYHELVISVVDRAKKVPDTKLIIKLARSSAGERVFWDLIFETYIPCEEKTSADVGKWNSDFFKVSGFYIFY